MATDTMSPRMRRARNVSIASTIIAVIMILSCLAVTVIAALGAQEVLDSPLDAAENINLSVTGSMYLGEGATYNQNVYACLALIAIFFGFGVILNIFPLLASIRVIYFAGKPNDRRSNYILAAIGAGTSFLTLNPVNGILLTIVAVNLHRDYVDIVGEKIAYKNGKRLGFMRFMEVICVLDLLITVTILIFIQKSEFGLFDALYWVRFAKLIMEAVALWFIWKRKQHGREVIMIMVAIYLVAYIAVYFITGDATINFTFLSSSIVPIAMLIYFGFAKRPRSIFTEPFNTLNREKQLAEDEKLWNPKSWRFWRNLVLYFCIFSVVGHWMEWCVCWVIRIAVDHGITLLGTYDPNSGIWSNMLNPFFVYGAALVLIGVLLFPMRNFLFRKISNKWGALAAEFVFNFILIAALELAIGLTQNQDYHLWDYRPQPLNFMGQICVLNTTFFTIMATIFTNLVYPNVERIFAKIPDDVMNVLTVIILVFFVLVVSMYVAKVPLPDVSNAKLGEATISINTGQDG